jgi:hypothetical protein
MTGTAVQYFALLMMACLPIALPLAISVSKPSR